MADTLEASAEGRDGVVAQRRKRGQRRKAAQGVFALSGEPPCQRSWSNAQTMEPEQWGLVLED